MKMSKHIEISIPQTKYTLRGNSMFSDLEGDIASEDDIDLGNDFTSKCEQRI